MYGNFDIILDQFSRIFLFCTTPHTPCDNPYVVPVLIGWLLVVVIRWHDQITYSGRNVGPNINNVSCSTCSYGYALPIGGDGRCYLPPFAPRMSWNRSWLHAEYEAAVGRNLKQHNYVAFPAPDLGDRKADFVGYSNMDFIGIRYELEFVSRVDIGCGDELSVNTSEGGLAPFSSTLFLLLRG